MFDIQRRIPILSVASLSLAIFLQPLNPFCSYYFKQVQLSLSWLSNGRFPFWDILTFHLISCKATIQILYLFNSHFRFPSLPARCILSTFQVPATLSLNLFLDRFFPEIHLVYLSFRFLNICLVLGSGIASPTPNPQPGRPVYPWVTLWY